MSGVLIESTDPIKEMIMRFSYIWNDLFKEEMTISLITQNINSISLLTLQWPEEWNFLFGFWGKARESDGHRGHSPWQPLLCFFGDSDTKRTGRMRSGMLESLRTDVT